MLLYHPIQKTFDDFDQVYRYSLSEGSSIVRLAGEQ